MVSNMYDQCSHCFKMYHVNINTSYQIADFRLFVWLETGWPIWASSDMGVLTHRMGRGFLWRRMCGRWSVFVRPFPPMVMSYSQGETAAPPAQMLQVKGMLYVTARGTPPLPRPGCPVCASLREQLYFLQVVFHQFLLNLGCVFVESGRQFLTKQLLKLQDPWSPQSSSISVAFGPLCLPNEFSGY